MCVLNARIHPVGRWLRVGVPACRPVCVFACLLETGHPSIVISADLELRMGDTGGWVLFCSEWLAVFVEFVRRGSNNTVSGGVPEKGNGRAGTETK